MVAKETACPLAAENRIVIFSPGMISEEEPVFWNVPDWTNGFESNTFSIVIVDRESIPITRSNEQGQSH